MKIPLVLHHFLIKVSLVLILIFNLLLQLYDNILKFKIVYIYILGIDESTGNSPVRKTSLNGK